MKNTKFFIIILLILGFFGILFLTARDKNVKGNSQNVGELTISEKQYDFGDIPIFGGIVTHRFKLENKSNASIVINDMETSCMCTKVRLIYDGRKSPQFGMKGHGTNPRFWSQKIEPGKTAILEVEYDPLAHGPDAVGFVNRFVLLYTNNPKQKRLKFSITANVVK